MSPIWTLMGLLQEIYDRIIIRTNFTATATIKFDISLDEIHTQANLTVLRALFHDPNQLRPGVTRESITREAAERLAAIAQTLRERGLEAHDVARFLDRIIFCLFAEDVGLLPRDLFARVVANTRNDPGRFARQIGQLFAAMAKGGDFGEHMIRWFNGNLFDNAQVLQLTLPEIEAVRQASWLDWGAVDPSILGTLFERGLDPDKRAQLGAHYTSRDDIETLIEPVIMQPLRREWAIVRGEAEAALQRGTRPARESADLPATNCPGSTSSSSSSRNEKAIDHSRWQNDGGCMAGRALRYVTHCWGFRASS